MMFIAHRINTSKELQDISTDWGVELDLRDHGEQLVLCHDPFLGSQTNMFQDFSLYLEQYRHKTMILNIKSEGIEGKVLSLLQQYQIKDYFFLDCSFPMLIKLTRSGERQLALRYSEWEKIDTIGALKDKVQWVWVDCFSQFPLNQSTYQQLRQWNLRLCLVSPELQGRPEDIDTYAQIMRQEKIAFDAICTKAHNIPLWQKLLQL